VAHPRQAPADLDGELAKRRTGMSVQRTRMGADRTLMAVIRTSLFLIGFGFTIFQLFKKLQESGVLKHADSARNFGESLVFLGIAMLILGIGCHIGFMLGLRREREAMRVSGFIHGESRFPPSQTLIVAILLPAMGAAAITAMVGGAGPLR
jgi:putative membrane protein